jgi:hypothetical protein
MVEFAGDPTLRRATTGTGWMKELFIHYRKGVLDDDLMTSFCAQLAMKLAQDHDKTELLRLCELLSQTHLPACIAADSLQDVGAAFSAREAECVLLHVLLSVCTASPHLQSLLSRVSERQRSTYVLPWSFALALPRLFPECSFYSSPCSIPPISRALADFL